MIRIATASCLLFGVFGLIGSVASGLTAIAAILSFLFYFTGSLEFHPTRQEKIWSVAFLLFIATGLALAAYQYQSGAFPYTRLNRLAFLAFLPLVALFSVLPRGRLIALVEMGAAAGSIATFCVAAAEYFFVHERVWVSAGNPGPFAVVMAINYAICILAVFRESQPGNRWVMGIGAGAAAFCILLSGMRTIMPCIIIIPAISYIAWGRAWSCRSPGFRHGKTATAFFAGLLIAGVAAAIVVGPRLQELSENFSQMAETGNYDNSLGKRLIMWRFAVETIPEHPILGIGSEQMKTGLELFAEREYGFSLGKTHLHNFALDALVRGGIVEFAALLILLLMPIMLAWPRVSGPMQGYACIFLLALTAIYLCSGMLNILFGHDITDHAYVLACAYAAALYRLT